MVEKVLESKGPKASTLVLLEDVKAGILALLVVKTAVLMPPP